MANLNFECGRCLHYWSGQFNFFCPKCGSQAITFDVDEKYPRSHYEAWDDEEEESEENDDSDGRGEEEDFE